MSIWEAQDHKNILVEMGPWKSESKSTQIISSPGLLAQRNPVSGADRLAAELCQQNVAQLVPALRNGLISYGKSEETADQWIQKAQDEIRAMRPYYYIGASTDDARKLFIADLIFRLS